MGETFITLVTQIVETGNRKWSDRGGTGHYYQPVTEISTESTDTVNNDEQKLTCVRNKHLSVPLCLTCTHFVLRNVILTELVSELVKVRIAL